MLTLKMSWSFLLSLSVGVSTALACSSTVGCCTVISLAWTSRGWVSTCTLSSPSPSTVEAPTSNLKGLQRHIYNHWIPSFSQVTHSMPCVGCFFTYSIWSDISLSHLQTKQGLEIVKREWMARSSGSGTPVLPHNECSVEWRCFDSSFLFNKS